VFGLSIGFEIGSYFSETHKSKLMDRVTDVADFFLKKFF